MSIHKPSWFKNGKIMVSTAPTCGLTKGGRLLPLINKVSGQKVRVKDPETGELISAIDDKLAEDMAALRQGKSTDTLTFIDEKDLSMRLAVPIYHDKRFDLEFDKALKTSFKNFESATIQELVEKEYITISGGHGSPSADQRIGKVPYIKVSDLRAGLVNINPTNRVPLKIAEKHWRGNSSKLQAYDLLSPERTSKNIGDFCVLMPGQEQVLLTKEIIVIRPGPKAKFDSFFLLWALTLSIVRNQWKRIVFMQTNREDVGKRYYEIRIPFTTNAALAKSVSEPFRKYFTSLAAARTELATYLDKDSKHHFFVSGAEPPEDDALVDEEEAAVEGDSSKN